MVPACCSKCSLTAAHACCTFIVPNTPPGQALGQHPPFTTSGGGRCDVRRSLCQLHVDRYSLHVPGARGRCQCPGRNDSMSSLHVPLLDAALKGCWRPPAGAAHAFCQQLLQHSSSLESLAAPASFKLPGISSAIPCPTRTLQLSAATNNSAYLDSDIWGNCAALTVSTQRTCRAASHVPAGWMPLLSLRP